MPVAAALIYHCGWVAAWKQCWEGRVWYASSYRDSSSSRRRGGTCVVAVWHLAPRQSGSQPWTPRPNCYHNFIAIQATPSCCRETTRATPRVFLEMSFVCKKQESVRTHYEVLPDVWTLKTAWSVSFLVNEHGYISAIYSNRLALTLLPVSFVSTFFSETFSVVATMMLMVSAVCTKLYKYSIFFNRMH